MPISENMGFRIRQMDSNPSDSFELSDLGQWVNLESQFSSVNISRVGGPIL